MGQIVGWVTPKVAGLGRASGGNSHVHRDPTCGRARHELVPVVVDETGRLRDDTLALEWCEICGPIISPGVWVEQAACRGLPQEWFFADESGRTVYRHAKQTCAGCSVLADCREYAMTVRPQFGVWAGMSPGERERMLQ